MNDTVLLDVDDGVATVTLNRPQSLNALDDRMMEALREAVAKIESDPAARCIVLRGAGDHFMAGGDINYFRGGLDKPTDQRRRDAEAMVNEVHPAIVTMRRMGQPILASVAGAAAGFGLSLVLAADLAIAADSAYFTFAYRHIGVSPDGGSTYSLPRIVGLKKAKEIALLGDRFDAATARDLGILNWVVPAAALEAETARIARRLADGPRPAMGHTKRLLNASSNTSLEAQLQAEAECFAECAAGADFAEGVTAFVEKRAAEFGKG